MCLLNMTQFQKSGGHFWESIYICFPTHFHFGKDFLLKTTQFQKPGAIMRLDLHLFYHIFSFLCHILNIKHFIPYFIFKIHYWMLMKQFHILQSISNLNYYIFKIHISWYIYIYQIWRNHVLFHIFIILHFASNLKYFIS